MKRLLLLMACLMACMAAWASGGSADSLKMALQHASGEDRIDLLNSLSSLNHDKNAREALFYAREAIKYASSSGDKRRLALAYVNAGVVLRNTGQSDKALDYFFNAVNLAEEIGDRHIKADALHKISVAYLLVRDFDNALRYGNEEAILWKELHDEHGMSKALNSTGLTYLNLGRLEEAQSALEQALAIGQKTQDLDLVFKPLLNLGDLCIVQKNLPQAIAYIQQSAEISRGIGNSFGMTGALLKLGEAYFANKEYDRAIEALQEAQERAQQLQSLSLLRNAYKALGDVYEEAGRFQEALEYNRRYISTEDSMIGEITKRKIAQAEARFEIAEMEREMERMTREAGHASIRTVLLVLLIALGGGLIVVLVNRQQIKRRADGQLLLRNDEIQHQTLALAQQQRLISEQQEQIRQTAAYAQRVQQSMLFQTPTFLNIFPDAFIHSLPKNMASGDFCWFAHKNDSIMLAIGDCKGHDMQGAFNTIITHNLLTQIVSESQYRTPADILRELDRKVSKLMQLQATHGTIEQMRLAVCAININTKRLVYAGAQVPLYIVINEQLKVIPADQQCIEGKLGKQNEAFSNQIVSLKKGDKLLLFTNGLQRQIGGDRNEAFSEHKLVELLAQQSGNSLPQMKEALVHTWEDWKGPHEQTDDILMFGMVL